MAILGGAKVSDKIPVIENLLGKADHILIGGAMAYTFFKAQGNDVGKSLVEDEKIGTALEILNSARERKVDLVLPFDHVLATALEAGAATEIVSSFPFPADRMAVDIGPETVRTVCRHHRLGQDGRLERPRGRFRDRPVRPGHDADRPGRGGSGAVTIVGGGDSIAAVEKAGVSR